MLIVRLNSPAPGEHVPPVQIPSVEKVPLPDRGLPGLPLRLMSNISALSGTDNAAQSARSGKSDRTPHPFGAGVYHSSCVLACAERPSESRICTVCYMLRYTYQTLGR